MFVWDVLLWIHCKVFCKVIFEFVEKGHPCKRNNRHTWMVHSSITTNCTVHIIYIYAHCTHYTIFIAAIYHREPPQATARDSCLDIPYLRPTKSWDLATSKQQSWPGNCSAPESSGSDPATDSTGKNAAKWGHDLRPMDLRGICKCFICLCHRYKLQDDDLLWLGAGRHHNKEFEHFCWMNTYLVQLKRARCHACWFMPMLVPSKNFDLPIGNHFASAALLAVEL